MAILILSFTPAPVRAENYYVLPSSQFIVLDLQKGLPTSLDDSLVTEKLALLPAVPVVVEVATPTIPPKPAVVKKLTVNSGTLERIKQCESGGNYQAQNARSTASGAYQFINGTWNNYGGYHRAKDAPPEVQDAKAREVFNAQGGTPWLASSHCWR